MATRFLAAAVATTLALGVSAHSEIKPSDPSQAERWGPQFLFGWTAQELETVEKAFEKAENEHQADPRGWDDTQMERIARIREKIARGFAFYDQDWRLARPFILEAPDGTPWTILQMTLPETITTGVAVSRDRYCRWEDQDMDLEKARAHCTEMNKRAVELFDRIAKSRHMTPGGNN
jgi:hypothetical protein